LRQTDGLGNFSKDPGAKDNSLIKAVQEDNDKETQARDVTEVEFSLSYK
jgi:hypothetical protein